MKRFFLPACVAFNNHRSFWFHSEEFEKGTIKKCVRLWNKKANTMSEWKIIKISQGRDGWIVERENELDYWKNFIFEVKE